MWMRRMKHPKPMIGQPRMWRTKVISGLTCEPVMSMDIMVRMAMLRMRMGRKMHPKLMLPQCRMWRTVGVVLESEKIKQDISDL